VSQVGNIQTTEFLLQSTANNLATSYLVCALSVHNSYLCIIAHFHKCRCAN